MIIPFYNSVISGSGAAPKPPSFTTPLVLDRLNVEGTKINIESAVVDQGDGAPVTDKGICWSTSPSFTSSNCLSSGGGGSGTFTVIIGITTPLLNDTIYYFRAYAQNSQGTYYSEFLKYNTSYVPMQFVIETTVPNETIAIAGNDSLSLNLPVDAWIDWADGSDPENFITTTNNIHTIDHTFVSAGLHDVQVSGSVRRLKLNSTNLTEFSQWGTQPWGIANGAFKSCDFVYSATDIPVFDLPTLNQPVTGFTAQGMGLYEMFSLTGPLFTGHASFNSWDVDGVQSFFSMFESSEFNADISNWVLNPPVGSDICWINHMFQNNTTFNQNLDTLDVSNVTGFTGLFWGTNNTASTLSSWDVSGSALDALNYMAFSYMFKDALHIPSGIGSWTFNTTPGKDVYLSNMFDGTIGTIPDITGWDTSQVKSMSYMFQNTSFNQDISSWDVSSIQDGFLYMFNGNATFNQDISSWDVSKNNSFSGMFRNSVFNQDISAWDMTASNYPFTKNVQLYGMFQNTPFNQDISAWDISELKYGDVFMDNAALSTLNYDAILISWESQAPTKTVAINFGTTKYTKAPHLAAAAHASLISTYGWTITDGGPTL